MTQTLVQITLIHTTCTCGFHFGMEQKFYNKCKEQGGDFYCPKCRNTLHFTLTDNEKLKRENELLQRRLQWEQDSLQRVRKDKAGVERKLAATKGVATRLKNRVKKGVCPCCNRYFANLHKHMESKHPERISTKDTNQ